MALPMDTSGDTLQPGTPSHSSVWPLEWSVTHKMWFFEFEVGRHDGVYKRRVHVIVPFVGRKKKEFN